jgi:HTH-type transcriptional regulator / antitoxin HipB
MTAMDQIARSPQQLGAALRRRRRALRLTQADLAARAALRQATVSSAEAGQAAMQLHTLMDLLAALDLELVLRPRTKGAAAVSDLF